MGGEAAVTRTELGWKFINWGLSLFIVGFLTGYIPILHYIFGGQAGNIEPLFLKNMTLWWGCPGQGGSPSISIKRTHCTHALRIRPHCPARDCRCGLCDLRLYLGKFLLRCD
jgi:hypothetical protein